MVPMQTAVLTHDGQRFTGRYRLTGNGDEMSLLVQFETSVICARKGNLPEGEVVQTLLRELVKEALSDGRERTARH